MTPCFLMLIPFLRYTWINRVNRTCHVELQLLLIMCSRGNSPQHPCSLLLLQLGVGGLLTRTQLSCVEGDAPGRLAGDDFRPVQLQEGWFPLPAFTAGGSAGPPQRWCSLPFRLSVEITCLCLYIEDPNSFFPRSFYSNVYFLEFLWCSKWKG